MALYIYSAVLIDSWWLCSLLISANTYCHVIVICCCFQSGSNQSTKESDGGLRYLWLWNFWGKDNI